MRRALDICKVDQQSVKKNVEFLNIVLRHGEDPENSKRPQDGNSQVQWRCTRSTKREFARLGSRVRVAAPVGSQAAKPTETLAKKPALVTLIRRFYIISHFMKFVLNDSIQVIGSTPDDQGDLRLFQNMDSSIQGNMYIYLI